MLLDGTVDVLVLRISVLVPCVMFHASCFMIHAPCGKICPSLSRALSCVSSDSVPQLLRNPFSSTLVF